MTSDTKKPVGLGDFPSLEAFPLGWGKAEERALILFKYETHIRELYEWKAGFVRDNYVIPKEDLDGFFAWLESWVKQEMELWLEDAGAEFRREWARRTVELREAKAKKDKRRRRENGAEGC